jgi:tRNA pseudouridine38-40 synthase
MRIAMGVEYDGCRYAGWQTQRHAPSIQQAVEAAIAKVANHPVSVTCAGRTDAGVHALGQVIHFDTSSTRSEHGWRLGVTSNLPDDIAVTWAMTVADDFSARFSAMARSYRYAILSRPVRPGLLNGRVAWTWKSLDAAMMHQAAQCLVGEHDFTSFRAAQCQARHARREVTAIRLQRHGDFIYLDVTANAFLHHMVRNIAGALMAVGSGDQPVFWVEEALRARDRTLAGITAPAEGLYFVAAHYPERFGLPTKPRPPAFA